MIRSLVLSQKIPTIPLSKFENAPATLHFKITGMSNVAEWSENLRYIRTADCDLPMKNLNCFLHVIMPLQNIDTSSLNILDLQNQICLRHHVPACRYESKQIIKTQALFNYLYLLSPVPHGLVGLPRARAYAITGQNIRSYMAGDPMWDRQLILV